MREGYVYLETHPEHPGLVRLLASENRPAVRGRSCLVRYVARFKDMSAGKMHAHLAMRRQLLDINRNLYRIALPDAMAAIEADSIRHVRDWIDPELDAASLCRLEDRAELLRRRHRRVDAACRYVGIGAIILLLLMTLLSIR